MHANTVMSCRSVEVATGEGLTSVTVAVPLAHFVSPVWLDSLQQPLESRARCSRHSQGCHCGLARSPRPSPLGLYRASISMPELQVRPGCTVQPASSVAACTACKEFLCKSDAWEELLSSVISCASFQCDSWVSPNSQRQAFVERYSPDRASQSPLLLFQPRSAIIVFSARRTPGQDYRAVLVTATTAAKYSRP